MKIKIKKSEFGKSWQMAEQVSAQKNTTLSSLGGVLCTVSEEKTTLEATDLRTSIRCVPEGVSAQETGSVILPSRLFGELFKLSPTDDLTIAIDGEKGVLTAGKNKTKFTTWPVDEFPRVMSPAGGDDETKQFCEVKCADLLRAFNEGTAASKSGEAFPAYLSACLLEVKDGRLYIVSTDLHRLAISDVFCVASQNADLLIPTAPVRELQRILSSTEQGLNISIVSNKSVVWFNIGDIEFSIRKVESTYPNYRKLMGPNSTTTMTVNRSEFFNALERINVIVSEATHIVVMKLSPGGGVTLLGKSPQTGTSTELVDAEISGEPLTIGFNIDYVTDGVKIFQSNEILLSFDGVNGQLKIKSPERDDLLYVTMPIKVNDEDIPEDEDETARDSVE